MQNNCRIIAIIIVAAFLTGCGPTVNYDPYTQVDGTPPMVNLLIKRYGQPDLEVQALNGPSQNLKGEYGTSIANQKFEFSILATGKDAESGIKSIKLFVTRTVCYKTADGSIAAAYSGTKLAREVTYPDQHSAPTAPSLGFTGVIDSTGPARVNPTDENLLVWVNANSVRSVGVGVAMYWTVETENFAGAKTASDKIWITAGDLSCPIGP
jgi:hypothetical protein